MFMTTISAVIFSASLLLLTSNPALAQDQDLICASWTRNRGTILGGDAFSNCVEPLPARLAFCLESKAVPQSECRCSVALSMASCATSLCPRETGPTGLHSYWAEYLSTPCSGALLTKIPTGSAPTTKAKEATSSAPTSTMSVTSAAATSTSTAGSAAATSKSGGNALLRGSVMTGGLDGVVAAVWLLLVGGLGVGVVLL